MQTKRHCVLATGKRTMRATAITKVIRVWPCGSLPLLPAGQFHKAVSGFNDCFVYRQLEAQTKATEAIKAASHLHLAAKIGPEDVRNGGWRDFLKLKGCARLRKRRRV
ncbi:uncharacterized protein LOC122577140 [Bombus pyrosoma]|uniref:uncharacterized protein LOC122577140 n=1 Tax=Bombus pyrosoma TaxID=396416 RepID=UPI001CB921D1|nr:uncharacterized protein LOC122577140 [Bombus pyrosoma]